MKIRDQHYQHLKENQQPEPSRLEAALLVVWMAVLLWVVFWLGVDPK